VVQAVLIDGECIERLLGERPLPVEHVMAPSILRCDPLMVPDTVPLQEIRLRS